ncbi:ABC transporter ATP-binding protein [Sneathiella sp.]|uniref:ABC transporter ATP-binding protein n=1 Tax=Sneathiella sp. TaxID=1964365 RepID=UPI002FE14100
MSEAVLQLENVSRVYVQGQARLTVLENVNLTLRQGEIVALLGPSGSGKSTLLHIAGLLEPPSSGTVRIDGIDCSHARDSKRTAVRRDRIGFVYQFHHLLPEFSALENVMMPMLIAGIAKAEARTWARALLVQMGLEARLSHRPAKLSGGEQQRVAIARALANNPKVLLADEPTGNLDEQTAEMVFRHFLDITRERGTAALVATHNIDLARRMDRIIRVRDHQLVEE